MTDIGINITVEKEEGTLAVKEFASEATDDFKEIGDAMKGMAAQARSAIAEVFIENMAAGKNFSETLADVTKQLGEFRKSLGGDLETEAMLGPFLDELIKTFQEVAKELDTLETRMDVTSRKLSMAGKQAITTGQELVGSFRTVALMSAAVVGAMAVGIKKTVDFGDSLWNLKQRTGVAVEELSSFKLAADATGTSLSAIAMGTRHLSNTMMAAQRGSKTARTAFRELGVEFEDSSGKLRPVGEVLKDVADRLSKLPDGTEKTALAMGVLKMSGQQLIPFLNLGREGLDRFTDSAEKFGVVMSEDAAKAANEYKTTMIELNAVSQGFYMLLAESALPVTKALSAGLRDVLNETRKFAEENKAVTGTVVSVGTAVVTVTGFVAGQAIALGHLLTAWGKIQIAASMAIAKGGLLGKVVYGLSKGVGFLGIAVKGLLGPIGLLIGAVVMATTRFRNMGKMVKELEDIFGGTFLSAVDKASMKVTAFMSVFDTYAAAQHHANKRMLAEVKKSLEETGDAAEKTGTVFETLGLKTKTELVDSIKKAEKELSELRHSAEATPKAIEEMKNHIFSLKTELYGVEEASLMAKEESKKLAEMFGLTGKKTEEWLTKKLKEAEEGLEAFKKNAETTPGALAALEAKLQIIRNLLAGFKKDAEDAFAGVSQKWKDLDEDLQKIVVSAGVRPWALVKAETKIWFDQIKQGAEAAGMSEEQWIKATAPAIVEKLEAMKQLAKIMGQTLPEEYETFLSKAKQHIAVSEKTTTATEDMNKALGILTKKLKDEAVKDSLKFYELLNKQFENKDIDLLEYQRGLAGINEILSTMGSTIRVTTEGIKSFGKDGWEGALPPAREMGDVLNVAWEAYSKFIGSHRYIAPFSQSFQTVEEAVAALGGRLKSTAENELAILTEAFTKLEAEAKIDPEKYGLTSASYVNAIKKIIALHEELEQEVPQKYRDIVKAAEDAARKTESSWVSAFSKLVGAAGIWASSMRDKASDIRNSVKSTATEAEKKAADIRATWVENWATVVDMFAIGIGNILQKFSELEKGAKITGKAIMDAIGPEVSGRIGAALGQALSGAKRSFGAEGAAIGGALGSILPGVGNVVGSAVGGLFGGLFGKKDKKTEDQRLAEQFKNQVNEAKNAFSAFGKISDETAEKIAKAREKMSGAAAEALHLADVIRDVGVNQNNLNAFWAKGIGIIDQYKQGNLDAKQASKALGETFVELVTGAQKFGTEGSKAMVEFIEQVKASGVEVQELTDYINAQLGITKKASMSAAEGLGKMVQAFAPGLDELIAKKEALKLDDFIKAQDELEKSIKEIEEKGAGKAWFGLAKGIMETGKQMRNLAKEHADAIVPMLDRQAELRATMAKMDWRDEGYKEMFVELHTLTKEIDNMRKQYDEKMAPLVESQRSMIEELQRMEGAGMEGAEEYITLKAALEAVTKEIEHLEKESKKLDDEMKKIAETSGPEFERLQRQFLATFNAMIENGATFMEALDAIGEPLDILIEKQKALGLEASAGMKELLRIREVTQANKELFGAVEGNLAVLSALGNVGALTQESFTDSAEQAKSYYERLKEAGLTSTEAMKVMAPTLEKLRFLAKEHGYEIDETTAALIRQAEEAKLLKEQEMSANDIMMAGFGEIIKALGGDIPEAFKKSMDAIREFGETGKEAAQGVEKALAGSGVMEGFERVASAGYDAIAVFDLFEKVGESAASRTEGHLASLEKVVSAVADSGYIMGEAFEDSFGGMDEDIAKKLKEMKEFEKEMGRSYADWIREKEESGELITIKPVPAVDGRLKSAVMPRGWEDPGEILEKIKDAVSEPQVIEIEGEIPVEFKPEITFEPIVFDTPDGRTVEFVIKKIERGDVRIPTRAVSG